MGCPDTTDPTPAGEKGACVLMNKKGKTAAFRLSHHIPDWWYSGVRPCSWVFPLPGLLFKRFQKPHGRHDREDFGKGIMVEGSGDCFEDSRMRLLMDLQIPFKSMGPLRCPGNLGKLVIIFPRGCPSGGNSIPSRSNAQANGCQKSPFSFKIGCFRGPFPLTKKEERLAPAVVPLVSHYAKAWVRVLSRFNPPGRPRTLKAPRHLRQDRP
ncbi:hypothetical protein GWK47_054046 [Chionoecetes opilio]|uniref:Uncharacterized protein n=1 Tax=Chionoecetes opilio TaxID=41210 RepID=A0A8J4Y0I0_CHIOP|nr:hypothetical protein GWK47_054046 [Chionoecetes opilio]